MPLLPDIPNELLVQIMKYLLPDDVDNFSESCKEFHTIAVRILPRHETLKDDYSEVRCGVFGDERRHPITLFRDILGIPEMVWYVKNMYIGLPNDINGPQYWEYWFEAEDIAIEYKSGIIKKVQECLYLDDEEREDWIDFILSCHHNTAVAFLACMFPCLEGISITDNNHNDELGFLIQKVNQANDLDPEGSHALSKLNWFEEASSTSDTTLDMESFKLLSALPSMRRYIGRNQYQTSGWKRLKESNITSLEFNDSKIHVEALQSVLRDIENLRDFTYRHYWACGGVQGMSIDWQPGDIILNLLAFARHSLVELDLTRNSSRGMQRVGEANDRTKWGHREWQGEGDDEVEYHSLPGTIQPFIGSLRGFQVLKYTRVQNEASVEEHPEDPACGRTVHRMVDLLPYSVVTITLAMPLLCKEDFPGLMEGLLELKEERVPKLKKIIHETGKRYKEMKTEFEAAGIQFIR